ncbi:MAG: cytochrome c3 family protein [Gemmatimonadales bacterium]|nr:cytochrome c3 family protein [Gemmatimonadales bacterium]
MIPGVWIGLVAAVASALAAARQPADAPPRAPATPVLAADSFPHPRHARLFTSCTACHSGLAGEDSTAFFPAADVCVPCHDGAMVRRIDWAGPGLRRPTNLSFSHRAHPEIDCAMCHAASDTAAFMEVGRARPERCLMCHAPEAASHLEQESCTQCHRVLTEARALTAADIARFPKPPSHDSGWVFSHRRAAAGPTCATCHAREFCASCHVNAAGVEAVRALPTDERVAALARARHVTYREPSSHRSASFVRSHGLLARESAAACGNCHARESCLTCHREEERVGPVALLPRRTRGGARGVDLRDMRPPDHSPDFQLRHRTAAAGGDATCSRCHSPSYCASCHAGAASPGFHGLDFVERHAENAYTRENDCAACHQPEAFCVQCHRATGRAAARAPIGRFHDAQPAWVFGHGGVARRAIENCASCHAQADCLQCHSASVGWRVNPHGRSFNAGLGDRNPAMCRRCHLGGPPRP